MNEKARLVVALLLCLIGFSAIPSQAAQVLGDGGSIKTEGIVGFKKATNSSQTDSTESSDPTQSSDTSDTTSTTDSAGGSNTSGAESLQSAPLLQGTPEDSGDHSQKPKGSLLKAGDSKQISWMVVGLLLLTVAVVLLYKKRKRGEPHD